MPSEKALKKHLHAIWYHYYRLQNALQNAHWAYVIRYTEDNESECCKRASDLKTAVERNTKDAIAEVIQKEIKIKIRGY